MLMLVSSFVRAQCVGGVFLKSMARNWDTVPQAEFAITVRERNWQATMMSVSRELGAHEDVVAVMFLCMLILIRPLCQEIQLAIPPSPPTSL